MSARWVFGYGSIIYKPDIAYERQARARLFGFSRRLWQGSPDHRGTMLKPGRVATLIPGGMVDGVAFQLAEDSGDSQVKLDQREVAGYRRHVVNVELENDEQVKAICYIADRTNRHFLGDAPTRDIAARVREARGKSGSNAEYVTLLVRALRGLNVMDNHLEEIARLL